MIPETGTLPETQHAVQLVGPGELKLNPSKPVPTDLAALDS